MEIYQFIKQQQIKYMNTIMVHFVFNVIKN